MSVATNRIPSVPPAGGRILICEDDPLIALGWSGLLIDEGYTVIGRTYQAEKALEMAYRHLPTLALIDIDLGGTIDGISVAAELNRVQFETRRFRVRSSPSERLWKVGTTGFELDAV